MADTEQSFATDVRGSIAACMAVLVDFAAYPRWSGPIQTARIVECHPDGRGRLVEFTLDMRIRTIRYVLEYTYGADPGADWRLVEGDLAGVTGSYRFVEVTSGLTRATCRQEIDLGFWVPGPIRRLAEQQALRDSVLEFKAEVERRSTGA